MRKMLLFNEYSRIFMNSEVIISVHFFSCYFFQYNKYLRCNKQRHFELFYSFLFVYEINKCQDLRKAMRNKTCIKLFPIG